MPRIGRPPKPTIVKVLTGNPGKGPLNTNEPKPAATRPTCPAWLDAEAKKKWKKLVPELSRLGLLTCVDGDALATYCQAWSELRTTTLLIQEHGRLIKGRGGRLFANPAVVQQRSAMRVIRDFAALFGLDPSSRSRLHSPLPSEEVDEFEAAFGVTG